MKKKLLLFGNNKPLITDFFLQGEDTFECMSCSQIYSDMKLHHKYYDMDAAVYCISSEKREDMANVLQFVQDTIQKEQAPFIVISDNFGYDALCRMPGGKADLHINIMESFSAICEHITDYIVRGKNSEPETESQLPTDIDFLLSEENLLAQIESEMRDLIERPRILLVDDSTIIHKTIKSYLGNKYDVSSAISGPAALRFLKTKEVNLILLDYEMPEMDGVEVLKKLRSDPKTAHVPIIFLTGINDTSKIQKALALKPNGYLLKPIDRALLMEKLKELIK